LSHCQHVPDRTVRTKKGDAIRENTRVTTRQVMQLVGGRCGVRDRYVCSFHEDMKVPDWFAPGQVEVSDGASPPRGYPPNVDSLSSLRVPAWRTMASQ
jgi:hypothetical protein